MPTTRFDVASIKQSIEGKLQRYYGLSVSEANSQQIYRAVASTVRDQIMKKWMDSRMRNRELSRKQVYYLSVEYLPLVEVIEVEVEKGFAISGYGHDSDDSEFGN